VISDAPVEGPAGTERRPSRLELRGVSKVFPGVRALHEVALDVHPGSVHALLGHNGCGKSTLVKILAGFHTPDGEPAATVDGRGFALGSAEDAAARGIRFVHQELGLILDLGAADNIGLALGYQRGRGGRIAWKTQEQVTDTLLTNFGIHLDPRRPLSAATPVERTAVAIVRAIAGLRLNQHDGLLVLDEPTAALPAREVDQLFELIRTVRDAGTSVLLISHRLDEVMDIADRATVLRMGEVLWDGRVADMSVRAFAKLIAGTETEIGETAHRPPAAEAFADAPCALGLKGVTGRYLRGVDLEVRAGEIVGIAGLLGSGREELPYVVAGVGGTGVSGSFTVDGVEHDELSIQQARECGIAFVPADRANEGVVMEFNVRENVSIAALPSLSRASAVQLRAEREFAKRWLVEVQANPIVSERPITALSGGNQQKAVLARWLSVAPRILVMSEPTVGIDIGARTAIYKLVRERAADGLAVLVSSSDVDDLVAMCDRVIVLRDGVAVSEFDGPKINKTAVVAAVEGVHGEQN
jgi:ribose transport system ATP-binding protein